MTASLNSVHHGTVAHNKQLKQEQSHKHMYNAFLPGLSYPGVFLLVTLHAGIRTCAAQPASPAGTGRNRPDCASKGARWSIMWSPPFVHLAPPLSPHPLSPRAAMSECVRRSATGLSGLWTPPPRHFSLDRFRPTQHPLADCTRTTVPSARQRPNPLARGAVAAWAALPCTARSATAPT